MSQSVPAEISLIKANIPPLQYSSGYGSIPLNLILAQAIHETGNFTSAIYHENNNLFGMKRPTQRPTLAVGENRGHAVYNSLQDSIEDYFMRQKYFGIPDNSDPSQYIADTMASGYAVDPAYGQKWRTIAKGLGVNFSEIGGALPILLGGVALYVLYKWNN